MAYGPTGPRRSLEDPENTLSMDMAQGNLIAKRRPCAQACRAHQEAGA